MLFALWSRSRFSFASRSMNTDCVWARASLFAHHLFRRRVDSMRCILFPSLFWSTQGTIRKNWFRLVRKIWKTIDKISWREQREKNQSKIWTLKNLNRFLAASSLSLSSMEMTCFGSISVCKPLEICFCICTFSNRNTHICYSATRQCTPKKNYSNLRPFLFIYFFVIVRSSLNIYYYSIHSIARSLFWSGIWIICADTCLCICGHNFSLFGSFVVALFGVFSDRRRCCLQKKNDFFSYFSSFYFLVDRCFKMIVWKRIKWQKTNEIYFFFSFPSFLKFTKG